MSVLVFGSANIDETYTVPHMVARGETLAATAVTRRSGGKGLNQAIAFARAGAEVGFAGMVGTDGQFLLEELVAAGVDVTRVRVLPDERTGVAVIQNDAAGDNCILLYGGANRRMTPAYVREVLDACRSGDLVVLQNEINLPGEIIEGALKRGLRVAVNPSPMDESVPVDLLKRVDYLLVNEVEAAQLLGPDMPSSGTWADVAQALGSCFPQTTIALTLGGEGSMLIRDGAVVVRQPALSHEVVDTTAAGDTFTGYLLTALERGDAPETAMRLAATASAITVSRPGAAPSIPLLAECEALPEK